MISAKVFAVTGAALFDAAIIALQGAATSPGDIVLGAGAGGTISVAVWWVYKNQVDQNTKALEDHKAKIESLEKNKLEKDDLEHLNQSMTRVERSLEDITRMLMHKGGAP